MSNLKTTRKNPLIYPSKFYTRLEAANILTSSYLLILSVIQKAYSHDSRQKNAIGQTLYCAAKMAYFHTKMSLHEQNLQLSDKTLKILARKTITYEKFYVTFAIL